MRKKATGVVFETEEWRKAVTEFAKGTRFEGADSINASMASIIYKGPHSLVKRTYRQTKSGITKSLKSRGPNLLINMAARWLKDKGEPINDQSVGLAAQRIIQARWNSIRYIVAGWAPAARDFGATRIRPPKSGSKAAKGRGKKATNQKPTAIAINAVGSEIKDKRVYRDVVGTMKLAVDKEALKLEERLQKRIQRLANKKSGK